jgi:acetyltransferase-like isoleucine patch superfamily enzyme
MSLWSLLDGGSTLLQNQTLGQRICLWFGYRLATRHRNVQVHPTCKISPEARICPRQGKITIGADTQIALGTALQGNVQIGEHSSVQAYTSLIAYGKPDDPTGKITIGNGVRIAPYVFIISANHRFENPEIPIYQQGMAFAPVTIEDDVWIGARVVVVAGVTIGKGSIIGAGAVVTRDIPPYSIAAGVPARVIRSRLPEATPQ